MEHGPEVAGAWPVGPARGLTERLALGLSALLGQEALKASPSLRCCLRVQGVAHEEEPLRAQAMRAEEMASRAAGSPAKWRACCGTSRLCARLGS